MIYGSRQFLSDSSFAITPEVGYFYFFPHYMMHTVYPFSGNIEERRSISFNATIELRTNMYNIGDHLLINIDPSQKMYVYVFSWNDAELDQVNVHKVFPNSYETELIKNETVIPNSNYELITTYPSNYTGDWLDEYLYVIMSKRKLKFSNGYKFDQFNQLLLRLDPYDTNVEIIGITIAK